MEKDRVLCYSYSELVRLAALYKKSASFKLILYNGLLLWNTTEVNSQRAFASLKSGFHTWEDVMEADSKCIEHTIRCGGLAPTRASCIKNITRCLLEKKGKLCLEYLRDLSVDEVKAELSQFKGIGPKTVFEIAKAVGWVPAMADRNKTYLHLNQRIPNELKFDLNMVRPVIDVLRKWV